MRDALANEQLMDIAETPRAYASLLRRYQALVFDGVIYCAVLAVGVIVPEVLDLDRLGTGLFFGGALTFIFLSEPLLVGLRGGTLGHFHFKIRVWDEAHDLPIGIPRAFGRAVVKGVLGVLSLILMLVTARAQSLHDMMFHSVVVPADAAVASAADVFVPEGVVAAGSPGRARRLLVILSYTVASLIAAMIIDVLLVSSECLQTNECNGTETLVSDALGIAWLIATVTFVVLGWRGKLIGCRAQQSTAPLVG